MFDETYLHQGLGGRRYMEAIEVMDFLHFHIVIEKTTMHNHDLLVYDAHQRKAGKGFSEKVEGAFVILLDGLTLET